MANLEIKSPERYFFDLIPIDILLEPEEINEILSTFPAPELHFTKDTFKLDDQLAGNNITQRVLLNEFEVKLTRTDKQYLRLSFSNNHGIIPAKMWDNQGAVNKYLPILEQHSIFHIEGIVDEYNNQKSLTISQLNPVSEAIDPFSLLPYTRDDFPSLIVELFSYIKRLDQPYRTLAEQTLKHFWHDFRLAPAAKSHHHNYLGGLLKHTVGLMRFAHYISTFDKGHIEAVMTLIQVVEKAYKKELYQSYKSDNSSSRFIWRDTIDHLYAMTNGAMQYKNQLPNYHILITAILFHDLGKILEYDHAGRSDAALSFLYPTADLTSIKNRKQAGISINDLGGLMGHIPYGVLLLTRLLESYQIELDIQAIHELSHCILCHHGLPEWGSAVRRPQTLEGYLVHIVDYLDSRYENALSK